MKKGITLLVIATLFWAGNYVCGRYLAPALPAPLLNTVRWAISSVILIILLYLKKFKFPIISKWREFTLLGFFGVFAFSTLNYLGLKEINASQAGMISAGIPVIILLLSPIFLKEKINRFAWIGAILSLIGVFILIKGKQTNTSGSSLIGEIEIILSCISWGIYTVLGKKFGKDSDPLTLTTGAALYGTIFSALSCIGTVQLNAIQLSPISWICIIYVSTFASVLAYLAWNTGVKMIGASLSAPFINLLPVWTVLLGIVILKESATIFTIIGGLVTIIGALITTLKPKKRAIEN
ncbi:DMT family transporter [Niallia sp. FSL R7-0648]|uniref:DMT family transporter n=1 Tax=Niallia sp. FSL R7-0648 TaxID=2954521 RepID=UPI0030FA39D3